MKFLPSLAMCLAATVLLSSSVDAQEYRVGSHVQVAQTANLQIGRTIVGHVRPGEVFKVTSIQEWLGRS